MGIFCTRTEMDDKIIIVLKYPQVLVFASAICVITFFVNKGAGLFADLSIVAFLVLAAVYTMVYFKGIWEAIVSEKAKGLRVRQEGSWLTFSNQVQYIIYK